MNTVRNSLLIKASTVRKQKSLGTIFVRHILTKIYYATIPIPSNSSILLPNLQFGLTNAL